MKLKKLFSTHTATTQTRKGFTLIELMIAISIVAILGTVGFTAFNQSQLRARDAKRKQDLRSISQALELYYQQNKRFPCSGVNSVQNSVSGTWLSDVTGCNFTPTGDIT